MPTVVRAKLRYGSGSQKADVDVERTYGPPAPTAKIPDRFSGGEDETLLVSLAHDGKVLGTGWPVFRGQVSLELGIPDMREEEAVSLLQSPKCADDLRALRDRGVRPALAQPSSTRGCASCRASAPRPGEDLGGVALVLATVLVASRILRRR